MDATRSSHVAAELFQVSPEGVALVAGRCLGCGSYYFPKASTCRNPECSGEDVEEVLIGRQGRLHSYTVQRYRPPALFRMDPWEPYAIGLVELPEGIKVMGMLTAAEPGNIQIGAPVMLVAEPLYRDDSGCDVLTYKFAPRTDVGR